MTLTDRLVYAGIKAFRLLESVRSYREHRATLQALDSCRPRELKDAGLIRDDFAALRRGSPLETVESLSRKARQRAGNW